MIFIVLTSNQSDNATLIQQAKDLTRKKYSFFERTTQHKSLVDSKRGLTVTTDDKNAPIKNLKKNETLYVVGHGLRDKQTLSDLSPEKLADLLKEYGLPHHQKHLKIVLVGCHTGARLHPLKPSYAERFHSALISDIHELELHHRGKEGSLLKVKAPKHVVGFRFSDGKAVGLKQEDYQDYEKAKMLPPDALDKWVEEHTVELSKTDFQLI